MDSPCLLDVRIAVNSPDAEPQKRADNTEQLSRSCSNAGRFPSFGGRGQSSAGARPPVLEYKKGWFWAVAVPAVITIAVVIPLAVTVANLKEQLEAAHRAGYRGGVPLSAAAAAAGSQYATAGECRDVIPKVASPVGSPPSPLRLKGSQLVDAINGTEVTLQGINWFGFNNGKTMVDGLDAGNNTWLAADFATIVYRLRLLGFNAVRLPFGFTDLESPTIDFARPCTPARPLTSHEVANATLPDDVAGDFANKMPQGLELILPMNSVEGTCNSYLPSGPKTLPRFLWVVEYLVANGMYVLIDYHPHDKEVAFLSDPNMFARKWRELWAAFTCLPSFDSFIRGRVFLDLLNEPDELGMGWSGGKTREFRPLGSYLLAAMDAINEVTPGDALFFIQGGGQINLGTPWGDGFATDLGVIQQYGIDDPNPFFTELLTKPYRRNVVLSPHVYGQSVTNQSYMNHQLWDTASKSWGKLMVDNGYCVPNGECQRFPVVVGEIGSKLEHWMDQQQLSDMATYMTNKPPTDNGQYKHGPISRWFWFCWNANSGDTGGLVKDDWQTLDIPKIAWLVEHLNLQPWWMLPTLDVPNQPEAILQEQLLPVPRYNTKRVPRNADAALKAAQLLGASELILPPTHAETATR